MFMKHALRKNYRGLVALGLMSTVFLFPSCSNSAMESENNPAENQVLTLIPDPSELLVVNGFGPNYKGEANGSPEDRGRFDITLRYLTPTTERQLEVFAQAVARWERIIIADVPSFTGTLPSAFGGVPPIEGTIDDIIIEVALVNIDGRGGILGSAGPRYVRNSDNLTLSGVMQFDVADLAFLDEIDLFEEVIVHEMGHVLGVGTLWNFKRSLRAGPATNPYFTGDKANVFWNAEGGKFELPIENSGGPGTAGGHWRESILRNELMTGYLNLGENPLSRITAGSMRDLGYGSSSVGESYELPRGTKGVEVNTSGTPSTQGLNIAEMEVILMPIGIAIDN